MLWLFLKNTRSTGFELQTDKSLNYLKYSWSLIFTDVIKYGMVLNRQIMCGEDDFNLKCDTESADPSCLVICFCCDVQCSIKCWKCSCCWVVCLRKKSVNSPAVFLLLSGFINRFYSNIIVRWPQHFKLHGHHLSVWDRKSEFQNLLGPSQILTLKPTSVSLWTWK